MNWLEAINYVMKNPKDKLVNEDTKLYLINSNGIPMISDQPGVYRSIDLDKKFCGLQWRNPITITKYNISVYVNNCLINSFEQWNNEDSIKEYVESLYTRLKRKYNPKQDKHLNAIKINNYMKPILTAYDLHKVELKYEPIFDEKLNIIRKEE